MASLLFNFSQKDIEKSEPEKVIRYDEEQLPDEEHTQPWVDKIMISFSKKLWVVHTFHQPTTRFSNLIGIYMAFRST